MLIGGVTVYLGGQETRRKFAEDGCVSVTEPYEE